jgi:hypothetical protein
MKHIIHVHQAKMRKNLAAIIDRTYKGSKHSRSLSISCTSCSKEVAKIVQSETPDHCGARVWIETYEDTSSS